MLDDMIWPKDAAYLAESLISKRLHFGKQSFELVRRQVSDPYHSSTDLTLELNILSFV